MKLNENDYVVKAEKVMEKLQKQERIPLTTTKIRGLLSMTTDLYNEIQPLSQDELSDEINAKINYLKVHFLYQAGRDNRGVKRFVEEAHIIEYIDDIKGSRKNFMLFSKYMEALIAYFKYFGGRD